MNINQLPTRALSLSDLFLFFSTTNGDASKASLTDLRALLASAASSAKVSQYAAPQATGFTTAIRDDGVSTWLILTPGAGYANGAITLPAVANCADAQEVLVNCTQVVTALAINLNGATACLGAPAALTANGFFRLRFDAVLKTWYRVG